MAPESPGSYNPYQSPPTEAPFEVTVEAELIEDLSRRQRKTLQFYLKYRDEPPTMRGLVAMSAGRWLAMAVLCGMGAALHFGITALLDVPAGTTLFLVGLLTGLWLGTTARDTGIFRNFVAVWPAVREVLNWQRIEERLGEDG
jgi:hypothetical protein